MRSLDTAVTPFSRDTRFAGAVSGVHLTPVSDSTLHAYVVSFEADARTAWHAHEHGQ